MEGKQKRNKTDRQTETDRPDRGRQTRYTDQTDRQKPAAMLCRRSDARQLDRQTALGGEQKQNRQTDTQTDRPDRQTDQTYQIDTQKLAARLSRQSDGSQTDIQTGSGGM